MGQLLFPKMSASTVSHSGRAGAAIGGILIVLCIALWRTPAIAQQENCYSRFYQSKEAACIDDLLQHVRDLPPAKRRSTDNMVAVGFLAQLFMSDPAERERIIGTPAPDHAKTLYVLGLYRAGLTELAAAYAAQNGWEDWFQKYRVIGVPTLAQVLPYAAPTDNDLLVGAYMASGDRRYLQRILGNFTTASDGLVADALRLALVELNTGATVTPHGGPRNMLDAACQKYQCKVHIQPFAHLTTLRAGYVALTSLSYADEGAKQMLDNFFGHNLRMKQLLTEEQRAFSVYHAMLTERPSGLDEAPLQTMLEIYERLRPAKEFLSSATQVSDVHTP